MEHQYKIMVSSSVYGFVNEIEQVCTILSSMGYKVLNSHMGTIKVDPRCSNLDNCLRAVEECDLFLGIIRPSCGTGYIGKKNITYEEMKLAIKLKKPYWFVVHRDVTFARKLNKQVIGFIKKSDFFDPLSIKMYNMVIKNDEEITQRTGNWAQEFFSIGQLLTFVQTQFGDTDFINDILTAQRP